MNSHYQSFYCLCIAVIKASFLDLAEAGGGGQRIKKTLGTHQKCQVLAVTLLSCFKSTFFVRGKEEPVKSDVDLEQEQEQQFGQGDRPLLVLECISSVESADQGGSRSGVEELSDIQMLTTAAAST